MQKLFESITGSDSLSAITRVDRFFIGFPREPNLRSAPHFTTHLDESGLTQRQSEKPLNLRATSNRIDCLISHFLSLLF